MIQDTATEVAQGRAPSEASAPEADDFGVGIFDEPPARKRERRPAPVAYEEEAPEPPAPEPEPEPEPEEPEDDFGLGIL